MLKGLLRDKKFIKGLVAGVMIAVLIMIILLAIIFSDKVARVFDNIVKPNLIFNLEEARDERGVNPDQNLTISFNKDVVDAEQINETQSSDLIQFDPPVPNSYRWIDTDRLLILPEQPLKPSTKYRLKIDANLYNSSILNKDIDIDFKTRALNVETTNMYYSNRGINKADINIRVNFNYSVEPEDLKDHLVVTIAENGSSAEKAEYILNTSNNSNNSREFNIILKDVILGTDEKELAMSISPGLVSVNGTEGMKEEYKKEFKISTRRTLMIEGTYTDINYDEGTITIDFSDEVDEESIESFISIEEDIDYRLSVHYDRVYLKSEELLSGQNYTLKIRRGLPSEYAFPLRNDFQKMIRMPDLDPLLNFTSPGFYLPNRGNMNLEMKSINVDKVDIRINKVYANNVVHFLHNSNNSSVSRLGKTLENFTLDIDDEYNETELNTIYLGDYLTGEKGIYQVNVHDHDYYWRNDSRFIILTDIGITTKMAGDQLLVWASSLKNLDPLDGATVSLLSYTNQVITTGITDENGLYRVDNIQSLIKEFNPYVVVIEYQDDFSFLKLDDGRISLADYNTTGRRYLTEGYEAFIYSDRGVYRPGDKANIGILVRGEKVSIPAEFPLNIEIIDPTGNTYRDISQKIGTAGEMFQEIDLPSYIKTGKYTVIASAGGEKIGSYSFNVEDFIPERIKVEVETDQDTYYNGDQADITVRGMNLFGPPASGRKVNMTVKLDSYQFNSPAYSSYTFGEADNDWQEINEELNSSTLDENGEKLYNYQFPVDLDPGNMIKAVFAAEVMEDGGRTVSEYKVIDFHPYDTYIGIKPQKDYYGKVNELYPIDYVILDSNGEKRENSKIDISIYQIIYHGLWRRNEDGNWYYDSETEENRIYHQSLSSGQGAGTIDFTPEEYGRYKVVMTDTESKSRSSYYFYASGWGYSPWSLTNPDRVEITFNKNSYKVGETAQIQLETPFNGKAMVTVEREKIYDVFFVDVEENSALIDLEIQEDWKPNIYITAHLIRRIDSVDKHSPVRAFGTESLQVDCSEDSLQINLEDHDIIRPNSKLNIEIEVPGADDGQTYLTLSAVDEGILQLTNFKTPDPYSFFYGKKQLNVNSYDLYNLILPEVEQASGQSSPSGGERYGENIRKQNLNPISAVRVKPVSLFDGPVKLEDGKTEIELDIPEFNGSLRLMAVAFNEASFGSTDKNIIVRNPIVLTPTLPRFIAPEDKFIIPVAVYNDTGSNGSFEINIETSGPVSMTAVEKNVELDSEEEKMIYFECTADNAAGKAVFHIIANGNGINVEKEIEVPVRPNVPHVNEIISGGLNSGETKEIVFENKWMPGTEEYQVKISPYPTVKFAESLSYLLKYPYGCLEQTTSRVFPLLYFDDLARMAEPDLFLEGSADYYIQEGILKIQTMQMDDGSFAYWPGGTYSNTWATIYGSHFLIEARKAGYNVANFVYDRMINNLSNFVKEEVDSRYGLQNKIYALYVLALADQADLSSMNYIKNHRLGELYDDSRTMLAAAYYYTGKRDISNQLVRYEYSGFDIERETGGNFNSNTRSEAIVLSVLADIDIEHRSIPGLVERLSDKAEISRWGTTQDNAFAFMALGKAFSRHEDQEYSGIVFINNRETQNFDEQDNIVLDSLETGDRLKIEVDGKGTSYYNIKSSGVPLDKSITEEDQGIEIRREYLDKEGNPVNLNHIEQGDMIIAKITVDSYSGHLENVVIVDMLPAGLEIENPRLGSRPEFDWMNNSSLSPNYMDIRDDRLLLFTDVQRYDEQYFYYALRAVTAGNFALPPIKSECMYEPEVSSINGSGEIRIVQ